MKKFTLQIKILSVFLLFGTYAMAQMPAAISIEPADATAMDEITLTLNVPEACFQNGSLDGVDTVFMHGGVGFADDNNWQFVIEYNKNGADGTPNGLLPNGDGTYSITFTPMTYFGVPTDTSVAVTKICCVFNDGSSTWDKDARDFQDDMTTCQDFFIPLATVGIAENNMVSFSLHPNPVNDIVTVDNLKNTESIQVYNVVGEVVKTLENIKGNSVSIKTTDLPQGIYMISVRSEGTTQTSKFLKK